MRGRSGGRGWRSSNDGRKGQEARYREGDHEVVVYRWGTSHDTTVILVHGIGMGQQYFGRLGKALARRVNVVAVDLPGFGHSPEPENSLAMGDLADLLGRALDALLPDVHLVAIGHSMGTQVVAELAVRRPDVVDHVVLIAPTVNDRERTLAKQSWRLLEDLANDPPIVGLVGARMYIEAGPRWFLKKFASMIEHRIETVAPNITQPTLVIRGDEDLVCPQRWVQHVTDLIPDATLSIAKGKGHEAMITGAEPVAHLVFDFLDGHPSAER